jgi:hypothetical protein
LGKNEEINALKNKRSQLAGRKFDALNVCYSSILTTIQLENFFR